MTLEIRNLRIWTPVLAALIVVDALWQPVVLSIAYLSPALFTATITPVAGAVDGAALVFKFATMIFFACWIYRAGNNLVKAGLDELEFTPAARIWWFFVPIASLFKPFQGMRELWNASRGDYPYDINDSLVSAWWVLWLLSSVSGVIAARSQMITPLVISCLADLAVAVPAILLIRGIAAAQQRMDGPALAEVFA